MVIENQLLTIMGYYAKAVEREVDQELKVGSITTLSMCKLNSGIRTLHHILVTYQKVASEQGKHIQPNDLSTRCCFENIAIKYMAILEKTIIKQLEGSCFDGAVMSELEQGIRMLSHLAGMLQKIGCLQHGNEAGSQ